MNEVSALLSHYDVAWQQIPIKIDGKSFLRPTINFFGK